MRTRDALVARHRREVDLDEVRRGARGAVRQERAGRRVGANFAGAMIRGVRREQRDVRGRFDDRERHRRGPVQRPAEAEVAHLGALAAGARSLGEHRRQRVGSLVR